MWAAGRVCSYRDEGDETFPFRAMIPSCNIGHRRDISGVSASRGPLRMAMLSPALARTCPCGPFSSVGWNLTP